MSCAKKMMVFDLDETLGYFVEFGMVWDALCNYIQVQKLSIPINQSLFNQVLDLYPEFLRPNIINILNYLKKKKQRNQCFKIMIYTNNQGPEEWAKYIVGYFEDKINYKLFDQIIAAFKANGKRVETCRSTHMKTHKDFLKCTEVPPETKICYLDDVYYHEMSHPNIYYIHIRPYVHDLPFDTLVNRLIDIRGLALTEDAHQDILSFIKRYHHDYVKKDTPGLRIDTILSKKILQHIHSFFSEPIRKTKRIRVHPYSNKTIKRR